MMEPRHPLKARNEMTIWFEASKNYSFRAYLNQGYPQN
jgi:hypothetical protein